MHLPWVRVSWRVSCRDALPVVGRKQGGISFDQITICVLRRVADVAGGAAVFSLGCWDFLALWGGGVSEKSLEIRQFMVFLYPEEAGRVPSWVAGVAQE